MKKIRVACDVKDHLPVGELVPFQGDLKSLAEEDYKKLRSEILTTGFAFPINVWKSDKNYIVSGHQRVRTIKYMEKEGYEIPPLPVVYIEAKTIKEAKRRVLQDVAQYGRVESQGIYEFMSEADLTFEDLNQSFRLPDINMEDFELEFFKDSSDSGSVGSTELSQSDFETLKQKCPSCNFEFDSRKT